jgi:DNA modification methylase
MNKPNEPITPDFSAFVPREVGTIVDHQTDLPRIAKDAKATAAIEACLAQIPSRHDLYRADARELAFLRDESVHLVVTSPPYWTLKEYRDHDAQMGHIADYDELPYRSPSLATRILSVIPADRHKLWFQQIWTGVTGASTKHHPAPYPLELAERLIRMFSFVGDTVLDPFMGTGTTTVAAARNGRNSVSVEIDDHYFEQAAKRVERDTKRLFSGATLHLHQT